MSSIQVSVIVVNYNTADCLLNCLNSILTQTAVSYEVIVVDNASIDESRSVLQTFLPRIQVLFNSENLGFGKANNQGARLATGETLLLLNPDAVLTGNEDLKKLYDYMRNHPAVGLATSKILRSDEQETKPLLHYVGERCLPNVDALPGKIAWVLGACMMLPRSVYQMLKGFDEDYFLYGEDMDLCLRVRKAGYEIGYCESVTIKHVGGASEQKNNCYQKTLKKQKALHLFYRKHYSNRCARKLVRRELSRARFRLWIYSFLSRVIHGRYIGRIEHYRAVIETSRAL